MDPNVGDTEDQFYSNKKFIIKCIQKKSDRLSYATKSGKSEAWNRFVRVLLDNVETVFVKCVHCNEVQKQLPNSGTSGLLKHKCHPFDDRYEDEQSSEDCDDQPSPLCDRQFFIAAIRNNDPLVTFGKHRGRSAVWERYERIFYNESETEFVKCKHCNDVQKHTNSYGTGRLLKHKCDGYPDDGDQSSCLEDKTPADSESDPLNDKNAIIEMVANNDQRLSFIRERGKSEAWNRFERIFIDDFETFYVKCKYCDCVLKNTAKGGTQGLLKHRCRPLGIDCPTNYSDCDSANDNNDELNRQMTVINQLTEENKTLKAIVDKCLNIIDNCLCVNKYRTKQRKEVNFLINDYNKQLVNAKKLSKISQNDESIETNTEMITNPLIPSMNSLELYRKRCKNRQRLTKSIKNRYQRRYVCDWSGCGKRFRLEDHLREHRNVDHLNIKSHECQWPGCEERFYKKSQLNVHTLKYHTNARFSCDQCGYKTTWRGMHSLHSCLLIACPLSLPLALLLRHKRIHNQEKCIPCDWPGSALTRSDTHINCDS